MSSDNAPQNNADQIKSEVLLACNGAWNGQPYDPYPAGKPQLSMIKLSLPAHTSLPWHIHPMPNIAYLVSGSLTVEDKESGECHTFYAGQVINETVNSAHRGYTTDEPAELLITYAGVEGQELSESLPGEPDEF